MLKFMLEEMEERVYRRVMSRLLHYKPKEPATAFRLAVILSAAEMAEVAEVMGDPKRLFSITEVGQMQDKILTAHARLQDALAPENRPPGE